MYSLRQSSCLLVNYYWLLIARMGMGAIRDSGFNLRWTDPGLLGIREIAISCCLSSLRLPDRCNFSSEDLFFAKTDVFTR